MHATKPDFSLSDRAVERIKTIMKKDSAHHESALRISVSSGGCNGFQYEFKMDSEQEPGDLIFERDGAKVVTDPASLEFIRGSELDFADKLIGAHFKINNPNAQSKCGCGNSFSFDF